MNPVSEQSDTDLVASARAGDDEAFAELWRRHSAAGRTVARSFSTEDADDVVAEAYLRILRAVRSGKGPTAGFRPYLFTTIRNVAATWGGRRREHPLEDATTVPDPSSTEAAGMDALDRSLTARAFRALPARWQEVLWYTEVEEMSAADVAPLLGLSANGTAALAYRAREGLRQAWIQAHVSASPEGSEHRWTTERVGAYSRGGLGKRDTARIERHLAECAACSTVAAEARSVGSLLAVVLLPLLLGAGGAAAYAATVRSGAGAGAGAAAAASPAAGPATPTAASLSGTGGRPSAVVGATVAGLVVAAAIAGAVIAGPQLLASPVHRSATPPTSTSAVPPPASVDEPPTAVDAPAAPPAAATPPPGPPTGTSPAPSPQPVSRTTPSGPTAPPPVVPPAGIPPTGSPVPPAPVLLSSFPAGWDTAATALPLAGTGRPGATIVVSTRDRGQVIGTTTVAPDGTWNLTADIAGLTDGTWPLQIVQTTAAGTSAPAAVSIGIDRTALAPLIMDVDTGSGAEGGRQAPVLTGTAEPGSRVELFDHDTSVATVAVDDTGRWVSPELITISPDYAVTARQTDRLGNVSPKTAPITGTAIVPAVTASGSPGLVTIGVLGEPGADVQVWADGRQSPYTLTLDANGRADAVYAWTSGEHRIGVVAAYGSRHGVLSDVPVTLP